jgi:hypothetical protein
MPIRILGCSILRSSEESSKVNIDVPAYRVCLSQPFGAGNLLSEWVKTVSAHH